MRCQTARWCSSAARTGARRCASGDGRPWLAYRSDVASRRVLRDVHCAKVPNRSVWLIHALGSRASTGEAAGHYRPLTLADRLLSCGAWYVVPRRHMLRAVVHSRSGVRVHSDISSGAANAADFPITPIIIWPPHQGSRLSDSGISVRCALQHCSPKAIARGLLLFALIGTGAPHDAVRAQNTRYGKFSSQTLTISCPWKNKCGL